jgi:hypothetical protein
MMIRNALLSLALMLPAPLTAQPSSGLPGWMTGAWSETKGESWTEEYWTPPRGGLMIGAGRNGKGKALLGWEATRIEIDQMGKIVFVALPNGGPATSFALENSDAQSISFTNPAHDYPQRVRYWRDGEKLMAETSLLDGGKAMRWQYRPMGR